jgi:hypothetical protein
MSEKDIGKCLHDLPEEVRQIIQRETNNGLRQFRAGNFEVRLQAAGRVRPEGTKILPGLFRRAWIPALGLAVAIIVIISAVLWITRAKSQLSPTGLGMIDAALKDLPGFRTLSIPGPRETATEEDLYPSAVVVSRALAIAAHNAAAGRETTVPPAHKLVPRYSLEQKMKILFGDKTIEQALSLFKEKFKEV